MGDFGAAVRGLNLEGDRRRVSFFARVLVSDEDIEDEALDPNEVFAVTNRTFPCLWVNITYNPDHVSLQELKEIESRFALCLTGTAESEANSFWQ
jgi:hypothetical protein